MGCVCVAGASAFPPSVASGLGFHPSPTGEIPDHTLCNSNAL